MPDAWGMPCMVAGTHAIIWMEFVRQKNDSFGYLTTSPSTMMKWVKRTICMFVW